MTDKQYFDTAVKHYLQRHGLRRMNPRAALCDMDGTLYDSMPRHAAAWQRMMHEQGVDCEIDRFFAYEGRTGASTINILFREFLGREADAEECRRLYAVKSRYFHEVQQREGMAVMPGAQHLVEQFMAEGIAPVLVTGSGQTTLTDRLNVDYPGAFPDNRRITSHNVTHGKPHPEPYLRGLELAGVAPSEAFVLENAPLGVESGVAAGVFTIAVCTGPIERRLFVEAGADVIFDSMPDCDKMFPQLLSSMRTVVCD